MCSETRDKSKMASAMAQLRTICYRGNVFPPEAFASVQNSEDCTFFSGSRRSDAQASGKGFCPETITPRVSLFSSTDLRG